MLFLFLYFCIICQCNTLPKFWKILLPLCERLEYVVSDTVQVL
jgi:hypothetical protein